MKPPADREPRQLDIPPSGVRVRKHASGLEIRLPWRDNLSAASHMLGFAFWFAPALAVGVYGLEAVWMLLIAVPLFWSWLTNVVNTTTVLIGRGGCEFSNGPLPTVARTVVIKPSQMRRIHVDQFERRQGRAGYATYYGLETGSTTLTTYWQSDRPLVYVKHAIETVLE